MVKKEGGVGSAKSGVLKGEFCTNTRLAYLCPKKLIAIAFLCHCTKFSEHGPGREANVLVS